MTLLGIELSDAGILAAAGNPPRLLPVDGGERESPGFALSTEGRLIVGKEALSRARFNPRSYSNRFWDELSTEPIKQPGLEGKTNSELAHAHLLPVWEMLRKTADEVVITVPGFYSEHQLGLLLGIAHALSIPVKGFVPTALAGSQASHPQHILVHLDIHLHRIEITLLEQGDRLLQKEVKTIAGRGLSYLYTEWVKMIADEFVRTTRFDPFDQAVYEQELYNRLPRVFEDLRSRSSTVITIQGKAHSYQVPLTCDFFARKSEAVFLEARRIIEEMCSAAGVQGKASRLQITHRVSPLPGWKEAFGTIPGLTVIELPPGSGALGALRLGDRFAGLPTAQPVIYITSLPRETMPATADSPPVAAERKSLLPTHILHRHHAYPLTSSPLFIGGKGTDEVTVHLSGHAADPSRTYCTIEVRGNDVVLLNHAADGTVVDGEAVFATSTLSLGQTIRVGTPSEELKLIACVNAHEKEKRNRI